MGLATLVQLLVVLLYLFAALEAIHDGHAEVQEDQIVKVIDIESAVWRDVSLGQDRILLYVVQRLLPIAC